MARQLKDNPPTSSAARFLNSDIAMRAIRRGENAVDASPGHDPGNDRRQWIKREFTLSLEADRIFTQFVSLMRDGTGTRLNNSHTLRAVLQAIEPAIDAIRQEVTAGAPYRLPGNGHEFEAERRQFESRLADAIRAGLRPRHASA